MTNIEKFTETKDVIFAFEEYKSHGGRLPLEKWLYLENDGANVPSLFEAARDLVRANEKGVGREYFSLCYRIFKRAVKAEEERLMKMAVKASETKRSPVRRCDGFRNFERFEFADEAIEVFKNRHSHEWNVANWNEKVRRLVAWLYAKPDGKEVL